MWCVREIGFLIPSLSSFMLVSTAVAFGWLFHAFPIAALEKLLSEGLGIWPSQSNQLWSSFIMVWLSLVIIIWPLVHSTLGRSRCSSLRRSLQSRPEIPRAIAPCAWLHMMCLSSTGWPWVARLSSGIFSKLQILRCPRPDCFPDLQCFSHRVQFIFKMITGM